MDTLLLLLLSPSFADFCSSENQRDLEISAMLSEGPKEELY